MPSKKAKGSLQKPTSKTPVSRSRTTAAGDDRNRLLNWLIPLVIVLITSVAFLPIFTNQFVNIDDRVNLLANPHYRGLGWEQLQWMFATLHNSLYRPITWVTLGADYLLWGVRPFGYHLTSLLFHCINALLVYWLTLRLLTLSPSNAQVQGEHGLRLGAGFAALVFAVHPLRVEVVAWASARNDVVAAPFFIMTILCYLRAVRASQSGHARIWMSAAIAAFGLSLLAKPNAITLPFVLLVLDVYPLQRLCGGVEKWFGKPARSIWWEKTPFLLLSVGAGVLALIAKEQSQLLTPLDHYGLIERAIQSIYSLAFYLWKSMVPIALSPLYELPVHLEFSNAPFLWSGVLVVVLTLLLFILRHKWPAGLAGWLAYLVILAPVTGIVQNGPQIAADRYSYLSCIPLAVLAGSALSAVWQARLLGALGRAAFASTIAIAGLVILSLVALTWRQTRVWRDAETLWRHALAVDENSFFAQQFLGTVLFDQKKTDEAIIHFHRALEINPRRASAHNNMANALASRGDTKGAAQYYLQAIQLDGNSAAAHFNFARLLALNGNDTEAMEHYRRVIEIRPDHADAHSDLGLLLETKGEVDAAVSQFQKAIELDSTHAKAYFNFAELLANRGELAKATVNYQQAARMNPNEPAIQVRLAIVLARQGQLDSAVSHFHRALELRPDDADVHVLIARGLAAQGKKTEAEAYYRKAVAIRQAVSQSDAKVANGPSAPEAR